MIMDNSKVWPHEGAKIVHSRYFTTAARLAGGRELENTEEHTGRTMSLREKERGGRGEGEGERKREEGRIALYQSLILYIVAEKTRRTREGSMYPHIQL